MFSHNTPGLADIGGTRTFIGQTANGARTATFSNGIVFGLDNSNVAGVDGTATVGAGAVTTGLEFAISLSVLGNPTNDIQIVGFISGGSFVSNQVFGGVGGASNLGNASGVNFANIAGNQLVTVPIPELTSLTLLGLGLGGLVWIRRRRY